MVSENDPCPTSKSIEPNLKCLSGIPLGALQLPRLSEDVLLFERVQRFIQDQLQFLGKASVHRGSHQDELPNEP